MDQFVPFPERVRYAMLKHAIDHGVTAQTLAKRLGWSLWRVRRLVMAPRAQVRLDDVSSWFFGVNGTLPRFELVQKRARHATRDDQRKAI